MAYGPHVAKVGPSTCSIVQTRTNEPGPCKASVRIERLPAFYRLSVLVERKRSISLVIDTFASHVIYICGRYITHVIPTLVYPKTSAVRSRFVSLLSVASTAMNPMHRYPPVAINNLLTRFVVL